MLLSVQLFTVREAMAADAPTTLARLKRAGLDRVELAGIYGRSARDFRGLLDDAGLLVSGSHVGIDDLENKLEQVVQDHRDLGCDRIILPWMPEAAFESMEELARKLGAIADELQQAGFEFAYHNHGFEVEKGWLGPLFALSPSNVKAQLDIGWVLAAGGDPVEWVKLLSSRLTAVHLKDVRQGPPARDVIAGEGNVDWRAVIDACFEAGVLVGTIEMDEPPGDPLEAVEQCVRYFESLGLTSRAPESA